MGKLFFLLGVLMACTSNPRYPEHWWKALPETEKQVWEIPPQAADRKKGEVILSKRNELGLLSNFAPTPFMYKGKHYASMEGFWQMMKYPEGEEDPRWGKGKVKWPYTRDQVAAMTAFEAHSAGVKAEENMKVLGIEWLSFEGEQIFFKTKEEGIRRHYELIVAGMKEKYKQNSNVQEVLLATRGLRLRPDHHEDQDGTIAWRYYEIWEKIRDGLFE